MQVDVLVTLLAAHLTTSKDFRKVDHLIQTHIKWLHKDLYFQI